MTIRKLFAQPIRRLADALDPPWWKDLAEVLTPVLAGLSVTLIQAVNDKTFAQHGLRLATLEGETKGILNNQVKQVDLTTQALSRLDARGDAHAQQLHDLTEKVNRLSSASANQPSHATPASSNARAPLT